MSLLDISDAFWSRHIWLPGNGTWEDLANTNPAIYKPQTHDLLHAVPIAVVATLVRFLVVLYLLQPLARYFHFISDQVTREISGSKANRHVIMSGILETIYNSGNRHPSATEISWLATELQTTEENISAWFAIRRRQDRPSIESRFIESGVRALYFLTMQLFGLYVLWNQSWLWNTRDCWLNYPKIHVPSALYWYYMIAIGSYMASGVRLLVSRPWPSDFSKKMTYLLFTLALLTLSWSANLVRFGSLVLLCHDGLPDFFVEMSKIARYLGIRKVGNLLFVLATGSWFAIRLIVFPFHVIRSVLLEANLAFPVYFVTNFLLLSMLAMHVSEFVRMLGSVADKFLAPLAD